MSDKVVSKKYALKEFSQVGLILIIYAFFCLYVPYLVERYFDIPEIPYLNKYSFDTMLIIRVICVAFASFVPFFFLYVSDKRNHESSIDKSKLSIKSSLIYTLVFCSITSFFTYVSLSVFSFFGVSTTLVSNIGLSIDSKYFNDYLYIVIYICLIPFLEEYAFRKSLLNVLGKYGKRFAVVTCSLIYAIAHCNITQFLPCFIMGYLLCKIYLKYRSMVLNTFIHVFYNLIMFLGFSISSEYNKYVLLFIFAIILISIILVLLKEYTPITLPRTDFNKNTFWMFMSRKTVIFSLILFLFFGVIGYIL